MIFTHPSYEAPKDVDGRDKPGHDEREFTVSATATLLRRLRQRLDAQRGDAVARLAQNPEAEAVEGEALSDFGNRARLVNDKTGDGGRLLVRQVPVHHAV